MRLILAILLIGFVGDIATQTPEKLTNRAVYTFQNKGDFGFLTSVGKSKFAITDVWRDGPMQKWRVVKGYLGSSYMFKPTSDEATSLFVKDQRMHLIGVENSGFQLSSSQYWTVLPADKAGFFMIQNSQSEECLESVGLQKRLATSRCRNIREQQWSMHRR